MAAHACLKNEFTEDEKYNNLMRWLKYFVHDFSDASDCKDFMSNSSDIRDKMKVSKDRKDIKDPIKIQ